MILCPNKNCGGTVVLDEYESAFVEYYCLLCARRWEPISNGKFRRVNAIREENCNDRGQGGPLDLSC